MGAPFGKYSIEDAQRGGLEVFEAVNAKCKFPRKVFGYWRRDIDKSSVDTLPFPVKMPVEYDKRAFLSKLRDAQRNARLDAYKGTSKHRWTGKCAGCKEYSLDGWKWPEAAITYIKSGVPPSKAFYKFIMGTELATLPY